MALAIVVKWEKEKEIFDGNVPINFLELCKMDGHSYKCVSLHQSRPHTNASQCIRGPSTRGGHYVQLWGGGTMQQREISRSRTKAIPGNASFLGYLTPSRRGGMPGVRLSTLKSRVSCHFLFTPPKKGRKKVTWAPPEAPALLVPASASDHCHPLGTLHV